MVDYVKTRDHVVLGQLSKYGVSCVLDAGAAPSVDLATGSATAAQTRNVASKCLLKEYSSREIDGTVIRQGDTRVLLAATALARQKITPEVGHHFTFSGVRWRVQNVKPIWPGGVAVAYWLQLRK